jgi:hypothetical protein
LGCKRKERISEQLINVINIVKTKLYIIVINETNSIKRKNKTRTIIKGNIREKKRKVRRRKIIRKKKIIGRIENQIVKRKKKNTKKNGVRCLGMSFVRIKNQTRTRS